MTALKKIRNPARKEPDCRPAVVCVMGSTSESSCTYDNRCEEQTGYALIISFSYSNKGYTQAFPSQNQECLLEGVITKTAKALKAILCENGV